MCYIHVWIFKLGGNLALSGFMVCAFGDKRISRITALSEAVLSIKLKCYDLHKTVLRTCAASRLAKLVQAVRGEVKGPQTGLKLCTLVLDSMSISRHRHIHIIYIWFAKEAVEE